MANARTNSTINPKQGDLIVANWTSYVDLIWLAFKWVLFGSSLSLIRDHTVHVAPSRHRFNPVFLLPVYAPVMPSIAPDGQTTPGRSTGTGSASLSLPPTSSAPRSPLLGYSSVSLLTLVTYTGHTPSIYKARAESRLITLDQARKAAAGPVCILPEATTSNGRGLLRFGEGFGGGVEVPVRGWKVWVCYFK
jgi:hypothetical protein